jgi:toxin ParE1/3/4
MRFLWNVEALAEFANAAEFYGLQESGLGERFADCIESAIESVCAAPKMWPTIDDEVRRRFTHTFPYSIVYIEDDGMIVIVAVMHNSREPDYWRKRLE